MLHLLWWWCLDYAQGGRLDQHDVEELVLATTWDGEAELLVESLVGAGFLDRDDSGMLTVHDWSTYAGDYFGQVKRNKARSDKAMSSEPVMTGSRPGQDRVITRADEPVITRAEESRGEERREEGGVGGVPEKPAPLTLVAPEPPSARKRASADEGFEKFWAAYPVKAGKAAALKAWKGLSEADKALAVEKAAVYARLTAGSTAIKYAQGWLNGRRWEDDTEAWRRQGQGAALRPGAAPRPVIDPAANEATMRRALGLDP